MHDSFCFTTEIGEESTSKYQKLRRVKAIYSKKKYFCMNLGGKKVFFLEHS